MAGQTIILIAISGVVLLLAGMFIFLAMESARVKRILLERLNIVATKVDEYQGRAQLILDHTDKYFNSLQNVGGPSRLQALIKELDMAMLLVDQLIANKLTAEAHQFIDFLEGDLNAWQPQWEGGGVTYDGLANWDTHLEALIQSIGMEVADASTEMGKLGVVSTKRNRKATIVSLKEAGVDLEELRAENEQTGEDDPPSE